MIDFIDLIDKRLTERNAKSDKDDFDREIREIVQEMILSGLAETNFFGNNILHGGMAIKILHESNRYSGDLDFNSVMEDNKFTWEYYIKCLDKYTEKYGVKFECEDQSNEKFNLKRALIKDRSILDMLHNKGIVPQSWTKIDNGNGKKARVQIETSFQVNTFVKEKRKLLFPTECSIDVFDINSLFAGKLNACLTRTKKVKGKDERERMDVGRDWYDLAWYVQKGVKPNYAFLSDKLNAKGPYQDQNIKTDLKWIKEKLLLRIDGLNYKELNEQLLPLTRKEKLIVLSREFLEEVIDYIEKEGYRIKYAEVKEKEDETKPAKKTKNKLEEMKCVMFNRYENKSFREAESGVKILENYGTLGLSGDENETVNKLMYVNEEGCNTFVLERLRTSDSNDDKSIVICDAWHFMKDFTRESAEKFIKQYNERMKMKKKKKNPIVGDN